jgi:hypothetical protein
LQIQLLQKRYGLFRSVNFLDCEFSHSGGESHAVLFADYLLSKISTLGWLA